MSDCRCVSVTESKRLGIYLAEPATPDYDAMILLDMTAPSPTRQPAAWQSKTTAPAAQRGRR